MPLPGAPYWQRYWRRKLSRRGFLSATALAGSGAAAAALAGCGNGDPDPTPSPSPVPDTSWEENTVPPEGSRGGTLQLPGFEAFIADTLDPHQTQFGPVYSSHSSVFSKVLRYQDPVEGLIEPDLAAEMPESPDGREYIIPLRHGVRFQRPSQVLGRPASAQERSIDGRELTAEDIVYSFRRQMDETSPRRRFYYRAYQYEEIETIEAPDPYTLRIVMKEPLVTLLHYLADTNAFIVAREAVDEDDQMNAQEAMIGTGPFIWDELVPLMESRFVRNPDWFGWDDPELSRPYVDGYRSVFVANDAGLESIFRRRDLDAALQVDNPAWIHRVREEFPELQSRDVGFSAWLTSRFLLDRPPYNDFRVRKALHLATERREIIDSVFSGSGRLHGPLSPILEQWTIADEELAAMPGYRDSSAEREEDRREARQLYEAAGSPALEITFADLPDYVPAYRSQLQATLEQTLGAEVNLRTGSYLQLTEAMIKGEISMTWQYENGWVDPDDWLFPFFHSRGTKNLFHLSDAHLDGLLEAQRRELDQEQRKQLIRDIQLYLLEEVLPRLDYASPINMWVSWPYLRNFRPTPFFGHSFLLADAWLDKTHPSYQERSSS